MGLEKVIPQSKTPVHSFLSLFALNFLSVYNPNVVLDFVSIVYFVGARNSCTPARGNLLTYHYAEFRMAYSVDSQQFAYVFMLVVCHHLYLPRAPASPLQQGIVFSTPYPSGLS